MDRVEELLQHICSALDTLNENIEGMKRMSEEDKEMLDSIKGRWRRCATMGKSEVRSKEGAPTNTD